MSDNNDQELRRLLEQQFPSLNLGQERRVQVALNLSTR